MSERGTWYDGILSKPVRLYDGTSEGGAVTLFFTVNIGEDFDDIDGTITLILKDGTLREKGFRAAATILQADPSDFPWERVAGEDESTVGLEVSVCGETKGDKTYWNVYPRGNGAPQPVDAAEMKSKYGSKLRGMFGAAPAKPPAAKKAKPPAAPGSKARTSTMEATWDSFCRKHDGKDQTELYDLWPIEIKSAAGKEQNDCTPEDWGKVLTFIEAHGKNAMPPPSPEDDNLNF